MKSLQLFWIQLMHNFQENPDENFGLAKPGIYYYQSIWIYQLVYSFKFRNQERQWFRWPGWTFSLVQHLFLLYLLSYFCSQQSSSRSAIENGFSLVVDFPTGYLALPFISYFHFSSLGCLRACSSRLVSWSFQVLDLHNRIRNSSQGFVQANQWISYKCATSIYGGSQPVFQLFPSCFGSTNTTESAMKENGIGTDPASI